MRERFLEACYRTYYGRSLELIRVAKFGNLNQMTNLLTNNMCGFTFLPHQPKQQAFIEATRRGSSENVGFEIAEVIRQDLYRRNVLVLTGSYSSFCNPAITYIAARQDQFKAGDLKMAFTYAVKAHDIAAIQKIVATKIGISSEEWSGLFDLIGWQ